MAFDRILVNSFFSREGILRAFGINSTVCYLGIDTERFIDQNKQREGFVVCLAALLPNKNIEFLIQSLSKVRSAMRPKLVLIANMVYEPYLAKLRELAAASGVNIDLKQRIDDAELIDILNRARMMLYAPRLEPFGFAPLEANACGVPVVAVAEGGVRETVQDGVNGLLVQHEPQSMAEAITRLLVDDELHRRLSRSARELVISKWSLQSSVDELERSLKTLVNKDVACDTPPSA
jgi:glycosyltransferase involved in cell wall biosynthesis